VAGQGLPDNLQFFQGRFSFCDYWNSLNQ